LGFFHSAANGETRRSPSTTKTPRLFSVRWRQP
jgi:hypothetical protein